MHRDTPDDPLQFEIVKVIENKFKEPSIVEIVQVVHKKDRMRKFVDPGDLHKMNSKGININFHQILDPDFEESEQTDLNTELTSQKVIETNCRNGYVPMMTKTIKLSIPENKNLKTGSLLAKVCHIDF